MADKDGTITYSSIVSVNSTKDTRLSVFPNPVVSNVKVSHGKAAAGATIKILTTDGQQVKLLNVQEGATQTSLLVSELAKGNYMVIYENGGEKAISKFIKQ